MVVTLYEFFVLTITPSKIKMETINRDRKSRMWEMKEGEYYTKSLAKNHVCAKFNMQEIWKK